MTRMHLTTATIFYRPHIAHYLHQHQIAALQVKCSTGDPTFSWNWRNPEISNFSKLPDELIHAIFDFAAAASPDSCKALCLVASWVRAIALPYLRRTIVLRATENISECWDLIHPMTPVSPLHTHYTRHLYIDNMAFDDKQHADGLMPSLAACCPNIRKFAVTGGAFLAVAEASESIPSLLQGADLDITILVDIVKEDHDAFASAGTRGAQFFSRVTHLYLTNIRNSYEMNVSHYTRLTHISILYVSAKLDGLPATLHRIRPIETLQMIVVVVKQKRSTFITTLNRNPMSLKDFIQTQRLTDRRIYALEFIPIYEQWKEEVEGGKSIWEKAVEFSRKIGLDC